MNDNFSTIQDLLRVKAELTARLNLLPYSGTPEVKVSNNNKYLYMRKRVLDKTTSTYVGVFSDELYNQLLRNNREEKDLKKQMRKITKQLAILGYSEKELDPNVVVNLEFARSNMKAIIYDQAILEGVATTFPDTETIIENGKVNNMIASDVQKILNLKHAWEFILNKDVIQANSDYYIASYIAKIVNEGFYINGGKIRGVPVTIGGTSYVPPLPIETNVKEDILNILNSNLSVIDKTIELCLYVMKTQVYNDGNKRTAVIFANHYLISNGEGLLVIPYDKVQEFKQKLVLYYEDKDLTSVKDFLKTCWKK